MALTTLEKVKLSLRSKSTVFDDDITDLIAEAKQDMKISGVNPLFIVETDVLILRAIKLYVRAHYGISDPDSEKYRKSYDTLAAHLVMSGDYNNYALTFDSDGGSLVASIKQEYGSTVTAPVSPSKDGYTFAGWLPLVPTMMPSVNTTYVAQWTINV